MDWESGTFYYSVEKHLIWFAAAWLSYLKTKVLASPSANPINRWIHNLTRSLMGKLEHWSVLRIEMGYLGNTGCLRYPEYPTSPRLTLRNRSLLPWLIRLCLAWGLLSEQVTSKEKPVSSNSPPSHLVSRLVSTVRSQQVQSGQLPSQTQKKLWLNEQVSAVLHLKKIREVYESWFQKCLVKKGGVQFQRGLHP